MKVSVEPSQAGAEGGEDEEYYGDEDEEEEEEEERKVLPERASRGKRYNQLLGEEEEKDAQFWGHDTWEEEEEDSGWSSEDERVELEILGDEDSNTDSEVDSQSDDGMEEEMEVAQEEDDDIVSERKPSRPKSIKGGRYKDPSLFLKSAQKDMLKRAKKKSRKKSKEDVAGSEVLKRSSTTIGPRTMSVRASTSQKKQDLQESIKRRNEEAQDKARRRVARKGSGQRERQKAAMTQEERLKACTEVEKMNIESLNQLEAFEEHRRYLDNTSASIRKQLQSGPLSIYISWSSYRLMDSEKDMSDKILNSEEYCREMIIYTGGAIPPHIDQRRDPNLEFGPSSVPRCCVYGVPAKYLDPLTNKYYSSLEAFKTIRREYQAEEHKEILSGMHEVDGLVSEAGGFIGRGWDVQDHQMSTSFVKME